MSHKSMNLPEDYALVLQQVNEDGKEDFTSLSETLSLNRKRLAHIIGVLKNKGLLLVRHTDYNETLIEISAKGERIIAYMWPESRMRSYA